jgi:hypothetical protein
MDGQLHDRREERTHNTGLAKVAVQCSAETFMVNQSLVLRINICSENRHLRQARKRQAVKKPLFSFMLSNSTIFKTDFCCLFAL